MSDSPSTERAKFYREEAKRVLKRAAAMYIPDIRRELELIARQYEDMADLMERIIYPPRR